MISLFILCSSNLPHFYIRLCKHGNFFILVNVDKGRSYGRIFPRKDLIFYCQKPFDHFSVFYFILGRIENEVREHQWTNVGALSYDEEKQLFLVQIVGTEGLNHNVIPKGVQVSAAYANGDLKKASHQKKKSKGSTAQFWVPRVQLLFCAEDPVVFAKRITKAYKLRQESEALIRYNLYVDCMPMDGVVKLDSASLNNMEYWARGTRTLKNDKKFVSVFCVIAQPCTKLLFFLLHLLFFFLSFSSFIYNSSLIPGQTLSNLLTSAGVFKGDLNLTLS